MCLLEKGKKVAKVQETFNLNLFKYVTTYQT